VLFPRLGASSIHRGDRVPVAVRCAGSREPGRWLRTCLRSVVLVAVLILGLAAARDARADDPTTVSVGVAGATLQIDVAAGSWQVDSSGITVSGSGTLSLSHEAASGPQVVALNASWTGVTWQNGAMTAGTISLTAPSGQWVVEFGGATLTMGGLELDLATNEITILDGSFTAPDLGAALHLPTIDLAGTPVAASSDGLAYLELAVPAPMTVLGVTLGPTAKLRLDLSSTKDASSGAIPAAHIGNAGVAWRGLYLTDTRVAVGSTDVSLGATLDYLSIGWPTTPITGAPAFLGSVTASPSNPFVAEVSGVLLSLTSGTLVFDSANTVGAVSGTFGGTLKLSGADDPDAPGASFTGLSVSYGPSEEFQFLVDHVVPTTPLGFGMGEFGAHVTDFGVDASGTLALSTAPTLPPETAVPAWAGVVIYDGELSFPLPGTTDGGMLLLGLTEIVLPFDAYGQFSGWLVLKANPPPLQVGDFSLEAVATLPTGVNAPTITPLEAPPPTVTDLTYLKFVNGAVESGSFVGRLTIPGVVDPVVIGGVVGPDGGFVAHVTSLAFRIGEFEFSNVAAYLDMSHVQSPSVPSIAEPTLEWTGLLLESLTATLPWPLETPGGGAATVQATGFLWDRGLTGKLELSATDAQLIGIAGSGKFEAGLDGFMMRFLHGDVEEVNATGTLKAEPLLDTATFELDYDSATGWLVKTEIPSGLHVFGGAANQTKTTYLRLSFTLLSLEIPSHSEYQAGKRPTLRMDGSVGVTYRDLVDTDYEFENVRLRSDGTMNPSGAWMALHDHANWKFHEFEVDVREIGFGTIPGANGPEMWVGLSGGIAVSEMMGMSIEMQADKFRWFQHGGFAVEEIRLDASIKKVVTVHGKVKFLEDGAKKEFRGLIDVTIDAKAGVIQGRILFVSGHDLYSSYPPISNPPADPNASFSYWGVSGGVTLPSPIPVGNLPLSIYGFNGGVAKHLKPSGAVLYDWAPDPSTNFVLQAGVTIGTTDQGFTFHGGVTLTVAFDPLIIRLDGDGKLLTAMAEASLDRVITAAIVYDSGQGTFDATLELGKSDAQPFTVPHVLTVRGMSALHVDATGAYLHVGTKAAPVTARVFPDLGGGITASAWFALDYVRAGADGIVGTSDDHGTTLSTGAYVAWTFQEDFKVCDVDGTVASGGEVTILATTSSFSFAGSLSASIALHACGIGFQVAANCSVAAPPFALHAACTIQIALKVKTITRNFSVDLP
jgi:hypothetical protein